ncbi:methyltransferase TYW3-domain-containing protein [Aspergillus granulosus]|uniref:tRNA(Phe) 7-[(3-amino-3-carboxypropyl)-4-demethylwyosine(37)-N(4)]-methyltransferase n=1 Tax=Aspergillus granulosus TaxID=176169 RepID=A0ABR4HZC1_9EURO
MESEPNMIPQPFISRKNKILAELSTPDAEYSDLSPKGSVDEGIRDLIQDINILPGLVTTSSCAGRISVFLEGRRGSNPSEEANAGEGRKFVPSGGKGAGKWLYVSHEPLNMESCDMEFNGNEGKKSLLELFGMVPGDGKPPSVDKEGHAPRLVRFHFEPMILHIMTATLRHAQPVLSAASSSGFRESGLQSLRCLDGGEGPSPIVAVRSAGLALESVIGYCEYDGNGNDDEGHGVIRSLVTEEYLQLLVSMSNERFLTNTERKKRFRAALLNACSMDQPSETKGKSKPPGWEDAETRRERKRAEGLAKKKLLEQQTKQANGKSGFEDQEGLLDTLDT